MRIKIMTVAAIVTLFAMAAIAARYATRMAEVPMLALMAGYVVGALSGCLAAWDWMRETGRIKKRRRRT